MWVGPELSYEIHFLQTCWKISVKSGQNHAKINELAPNQVRMAPFEVILKQNGLYRVWEASGMPPGL